MKQTVLITGGAGFLGSHLCERLLKENFKVICMDNLITGDLKNIEAFIADENFLFIKHDVTNYIHVPGEVDYILHFASPASPLDYLTIPIQTLKVGSLGTHKVLGLAKEKKSVFLLASTSEVYGDPLIHPQDEEYWGNVNPIGPRGVYDEAKRFAESITMAYHRFHKLETRIARIFNTYGPKMRLKDGRAIPNFINQALKSELITIYGNGNQTRSFCYVDDMVEGIIKLMFSNEVLPVNLGNPEEITVNQLAKEIVEITGSKSNIKYETLPEDDPKIRQPDITKAIKLLNWKPKESRKEGLKKTIEYFKQNLI